MNLYDIFVLHYVYIYVVHMYYIFLIIQPLYDVFIDLYFVLILNFFCRVMFHHFCVACEIEQTYRGHLSIAIHVHHCPFRRHHY